MSIGRVQHRPWIQGFKSPDEEYVDQICEKKKKLPEAMRKDHMRASEELSLVSLVTQYQEQWVPDATRQTEKPHHSWIPLQITQKPLISFKEVINLTWGGTVIPFNFKIMLFKDQTVSK